MKAFLNNLALIAYAGSFSLFHYKAGEKETFKDITSEGFFSGAKFLSKGCVLYVTAEGETRQFYVDDNINIVDMAADVDPEKVVTDKLISQVAGKLRSLAEDDAKNDDDNVSVSIKDFTPKKTDIAQVDENMSVLAEIVNAMLAVLRENNFIRLEN